MVGSKIDALCVNPCKSVEVLIKINKPPSVPPQDIFQEVYEADYRSKYEAAGVWWVVNTAQFIYLTIIYSVIISKM